MSDKTQDSKYALITGATSGIGYELARQLAENGHNLVLVARDEQQLINVKDEFTNYGVQIETLSIDLFQSSAAKEVYEFAKSKNIVIDVLVNDAGQGQYGKFIETDLERQLNIIQLNILSLVSLTYYFMKDMVKRNEGKILQLGSEVSKVPSPMMSVYAATKSFVLSFSEGLINELKDTNVTMTVLMPGATDTDFFHKADMENTKVYREGKMESPVDVAVDAYEALMKGERRIVASNAKMNVAMAAVTPDNINANKMRKSMEPSDKPLDEVKKNPDHEQSLKEKKNSKSEK
jgi:short-subunit dehydrogenase